MKRTFTLHTINLFLFDGGEGGAAAAPTVAPATAGDAGGDGKPQGAAAKAPTEVQYGKQTAKATEPSNVTTTPSDGDKPTTVDRRAEFRKLINGEFKDLYTEETQRLINRRFREASRIKDAQEKMQPIMDLLASRYGITDGNPERLLSALQGDTAYWQEAANQAGMTVEQYQQMRRLEAQNRHLIEQREKTQAEYLAERRYAQWEADAEKLKEKYPDFTLESMRGNDLFFLMLKNNYPMEQAYRASMVDSIEAKSAAKAEEAVTANIKARGNRPPEVGASSNPAFTIKDDVNKLSDQDVLDVMKQIGNGGKITFG